MRCSMVMLAASWFILLVTAQSNMNSLGQRIGRRYCGETLINMLQFLCDGVYKRSGSTEMSTMDWLSRGDWETGSPFAYGERPYFPFKTRNNAVSLIPRQNAYKRMTGPIGVADECCVKPCTLDEMSTYCGVRSR